MQYNRRGEEALTWESELIRFRRHIRLRERPRRGRGASLRAHCSAGDSKILKEAFGASSGGKECGKGRRVIASRDADIMAVLHMARAVQDEVGG